jgi:hypothetical protein
MNVRIMKAAWSDERNGYRTYECIYVIGSVRRDAWQSVSRCVHHETYAENRAGIEKSVHEGMGLTITQELLKGLK